MMSDQVKVIFTRKVIRDIAKAAIEQVAAQKIVTGTRHADMAVNTLCKGFANHQNRENSISYFSPEEAIAMFNEAFRKVRSGEVEILDSRPPLSERISNWVMHATKKMGFYRTGKKS